MPKPKNKKQAEFAIFLYPIHKNQWKNAYNKLISKISRLKSTYKLDLEEKILEAYGQPCPYCKKRMTIRKDEKFSIDHIVPTSRGGENSLSNVEVICVSCNRRKGMLTRSEYLKLLEVLKSFPDEAKQYIMAKLGTKPPHF